jgi:ribosome-binding ATPase YchF (GTP1/OBG family)
MKLGIIGLPRSGKSTLFDALTKNRVGAEHKGVDRIAVIRVPDDRLDALSQMYQPKKTTYAQVEYFLPGYTKDSLKDQSIWVSVRDCDALLHVVRNHATYGFEKQSPSEDFIKLDQEFILSDMVVAEKRLERLELDRQRGNKIDNEELALLAECRQTLENESWFCLTTKTMMTVCRMPKLSAPRKPAWWSGASWNRNLHKCLPGKLLNFYPNLTSRHPLWIASSGNLMRF